ncbi:MAG: Lipid A biosynthesis lauroyltransferase [Myxococcota bacterium]|nr:Lipid A biosynthesis lauroyltransferase [Myxococcota bacterium]
MRLLLELTARVLALLPWSSAEKIGEIIGWAWFYLVPIRRGLVKRQLREAFGENLDSEQTNAIARECIRNTARSAFTMLKLSTMDRGQITDLVATEGLEHYENARALGRGVLVLTLHIGHWDLFCCAQAARGSPLTIVTRRLKSAAVDRFWMETRARFGLRLVSRGGQAARELTAALKRNEAVGYILDQHAPGRDGVITPFFGRPAATSSGLARLAWMTGAPVLPAYCLYEAPGRYRAVVMPALQLVESQDRARFVAANTALFAQVIESIVRQHPDQWLWLHRRWKVKPDTELPS